MPTITKPTVRDDNMPKMIMPLANDNPVPITTISTALTPPFQGAFINCQEVCSFMPVASGCYRFAAMAEKGAVPAPSSRKHVYQSVPRPSPSQSPRSFSSRDQHSGSRHRRSLLLMDSHRDVIVFLLTVRRNE